MHGFGGKMYTTRNKSIYFPSFRYSLLEPQNIFKCNLAHLFRDNLKTGLERHLLQLMKISIPLYTIFLFAVLTSDMPHAPKILLDKTEGRAWIISS